MCCWSQGNWSDHGINLLGWPQKNKNSHTKPLLYLLDHFHLTNECNSCTHWIGYMHPLFSLFCKLPFRKQKLIQQGAMYISQFVWISVPKAGLVEELSNVARFQPFSSSLYLYFCPSLNSYGNEIIPSPRLFSMKKMIFTSYHSSIQWELIKDWP